MKPEQLASFIKKAGKTKRILEFQYPFLPDFYVMIAYANRFLLNQVREEARETFTNPRTRQPEERMNDDKFRTEYAKQLVKGWRGLTLAKLNKLVPGTIELALAAIKEENKKNPEVKIPSIEELGKTDVPFDNSTVLVVIEESIDFDNWVADQALNVDNYSKIAEQKEKEIENLK